MWWGRLRPYRPVESVEPSNPQTFETQLASTRAWPSSTGPYGGVVADHVRRRLQACHALCTREAECAKIWDDKTVASDKQDTATSPEEQFG